MTEELLDKAYKLNEEIKGCKKILKAMNSPYVNIIRFNDYDGDREVSQIVTLNSEPELERYIREYFIHKLEVLEQEFAKLNLTLVKKKEKGYDRENLSGRTVKKTVRNQSDAR